MPTIPNGFKPVVASYSFGGTSGTLRTEVAGGAPRYGLDYDRGVQQYNVTLILDAAQFSVWVAFYHHIIKKGSIAFTMPLDSGFGTESHTCNIVPDSYSATRTSGIGTVVSFIVEAESTVYGISAADAQALIDLYNSYGADYADILARIEEFVLADTLVLV